MIVKELYCYEREAGKITVSTEKPDCDYDTRYRLIADKDKKLTQNGIQFTTCIDVNSTFGWYEVEVKAKADTTRVY